MSDSFDNIQYDIDNIIFSSSWEENWLKISFWVAVRETARSQGISNAHSSLGPRPKLNGDPTSELGAMTDTISKERKFCRNSGKCYGLNLDAFFNF